MFRLVFHPRSKLVSTARFLTVGSGPDPSPFFNHSQLPIVAQSSRVHFTLPPCHLFSSSAGYGPRSVSGVDYSPSVPARKMNEPLLNGGC